MENSKLTVALAVVDPEVVVNCVIEVTPGTDASVFASVSVPGVAFVVAYPMPSIRTVRPITFKNPAGKLTEPTVAVAAVATAPSAGNGGYDRTCTPPPGIVVLA